MENVIDTITLSADPIEQSEPEPMQAPIEQSKTDSEPNAYETIIAQQKAQIDALIAQSNTLTEQITRMVQNGAQFQTQPVQAQPVAQTGSFNPQSLADQESFFTMEDLAKEIGKR